MYSTVCFSCFTYTADKDVQGRGKTRVPDPYHFNDDPDPAFYFNADPDPAFPFNADPEPDSHQGYANQRQLAYRPSRSPF